MVSKIDILEPYYKSEIKVMKQSNPQIKEIYNTTAENFDFKKKYNVIFGSWLFGNLTDKNAVKFLIKCKANLEANGVFIIKENIESETMQSKSKLKQRIRTLKSYEILFNLARFKIIYSEDTKDWPEECFNLKVFVLN